VTGWPTLVKAFGFDKKPVIDRLREWVDAATGLLATIVASAGTGKGAEKEKLLLRCLADVEVGPFEFLVEGVIPLGKATMFGGRGGLGKSLITLDLTAAVTRGRCAFGLDYTPPPPADVLLCFAEDDARDTVVPRLLAAGADLTRVHELVCKLDKEGKRKHFSLADCSLLDATLRDNPRIRLVVIDPIGVFCGRTDVDTHKDADVQALFSNLRELAETHRVAVLLIGHLNKNENQRAHHRISGSAAFVNATRATFVFTTDAADKNRRLILSVKFNCGPEPAGLVYDIRSLSDEEKAVVRPDLAHLKDADQQRLLGQMHRVEWKGTTEENVDDVMSRRYPSEPQDRERAAAWLKEYLAAKPVESDKCVFEGNRALALTRAGKWWREVVLKPLLNGQPRRVGFGPGARYYFTLPSHPWPFPNLEPEREAEMEAEVQAIRDYLLSKDPPASTPTTEPPTTGLPASEPPTTELPVTESPDTVQTLHAHHGIHGDGSFLVGYCSTVRY
jgi:hypothetical protein